MAVKILEDKVNNFRILVRKAIGGLSPEKEEFLFDLPEVFWKEVLKTNFGDNYALAERVILERIDDIARIDDERSALNAKMIDNLSYSADIVSKQILANKPILLITDNDNDGSLSQSVANQFQRLETIAGRGENFIIEYARTVDGNGVRGFSKELVEALIKEHKLDPNELIVMTADNGINSVAEQKRLREVYPNLQLIVTDHHEPEEGMLIQEDDKTIVVNPKYQALAHQSPEMLKERNPLRKQEDYAHFEKFNISGASTLSVLFEEVATLLPYEERHKAFIDETVNHLKMIKKVSNVLDYVDVSAEDKLQRTIDVKRFQGISSTLNINNSMAKLIVKSAQTNGQFRMPVEGLEGVPSTVFALNKQAQSIISLYKKEIEQRSLFEKEKKEDDVYTNSNFLVQFTELLSFLPNLEGLEKSLPELIASAEKEMTLLRETMNVELEAEYKKALEIKVAKAKKKVANPALTETEKKKIERDHPRYLEYGALKSFVENCQRFEKMGLKSLFKSENENYIEQLRPIILSVMTAPQNDAYMLDLSEQAIKVFDSLRVEERKILEVIRNRNDILDKIETGNVSISVVKQEMLGAFNRKLINKAFNGSQQAFSLTIDNVSDTKIAGTFRSLYDIDGLIKDIEPILKKHNVHLETPGHKRAAGFILTEKDGKKLDSLAVLQDIAQHIEKNTVELKKGDVLSQSEILFSAEQLSFAEKFNDVIRGSLPHNVGLNPVIRLSPSMVKHDMKTGLIHAIDDLIKDKKYGYITLDTELAKEGSKAIIIPVQIMKEIIKSGVNKDGYYNDLVKVKYLDNGAFMVANIEKATDLSNNLSFITPTNKTAAITEAFKNGGNDKPLLVSREEVKNSPWFKNGLYGKESFENFENLMVETLNNPKNRAKDGFLTLDVEAIGTANAPMINIGVAKWEIIPNSGEKIKTKEFEDKFYQDSRNENFLISEPKKLKAITEDEYLALIKEGKADSVMVKKSGDSERIFAEVEYFLYDGKKQKVGNYKRKGEEVIFNQQIQCQTLSYLIKEDFKVPLSLTHLTGITTEQLNSYGKTIKDVEKGLLAFIGSQEMMVNAHNTNYDMGVLSANTESLANTIKGMKLNDTTLFSKGHTLAYDSLEFATFAHVKEIPNTALFPYNINAEYNLISFLRDKKGTYFDFSGEHKLSFENGQLYYEKMTAQEYSKSKVNLPKQEDMELNAKDKESIEKTNVEQDHLEKILLEAGFNKSLLKIVSAPPVNLTKYSAQIISDTMIAKDILLEDVLAQKPKMITDFSKYDILDEKNMLKFQQGLSLHRPLEQQVLESGLIEMFESKKAEFIGGSRKQNENAFMQTLFGFLNEFGLDTAFGQKISDKVMPEEDKKSTKTEEPTPSTESMEYEKDEDEKFTRQFIEEIKRFTAEWTGLNKELYNAHQDTWMMRKILKATSPTIKNLNPQNYEIVANHTGVPIEKVETYLKKAYEYCKRHNIKGNPMLEELHVNGVENGDVVNETITTFSMLANKTKQYNVGLNVDRLGIAQHAVEASGDRFTHNYLSRITSQALTEVPADDAASFYQAKLYEGKSVVSSGMQEILHRRNIRENTNGEFISGDSFVKFKLGGVLPDHTYVVGIAKEPLSQEQIEEDSKKIGFVQKVLQTNNLKTGTMFASEMLYPKNKVDEIKKDLSERYVYLEYDRNPEEMKYFLDYLSDEKSFTKIKTGNALSLFPHNNPDSTFSTAQIVELQHIAKDIMKSYQEQYQDNLIDLYLTEPTTFESLPIMVQKSTVMTIRLSEIVDYCEKNNWQTSRERAWYKYQEEGIEQKPEDMILDHPERRTPLQYAVKHGFVDDILPIGLNNLYVKQEYNALLDEEISRNAKHPRNTLEM